MVPDRLGELDEHGFRVNLLTPAFLLRARNGFGEVRRSRETKV